MAYKQKPRFGMKVELPGPLPNIIIVDDTIDLVRVYSRFFEMAGFKVVSTFFDGSEIVEYVRSFVNDVPRLEQISRSVIICDYRMPKMNGVQATKVLRELLGDRLTVILNTADDESSLRLPEGLFDGILHKPFSITDFVRLLEKLFREGKSSLFQGRLISQEIGREGDSRDSKTD